MTANEKAVKLSRDLRVTHDDRETLKRSTTANPSNLAETQRKRVTVITALPL